MEFVKNIIKCVSGLDFQSFDYSVDALLEHLNQKYQCLMLDFYKTPKELLRFCRLQPNCIYELRTFFGASHMIFYSLKTNCIYSLGPALNEPFSKHKAIQELRKMGISKELTAKFLIFGASLPVIDKGVLNRLSLMLHEKISGASCAVSYETIKLFKNELPPFSEPPLQINSAAMRKIEQRYEISRALTEAVKQGNYSMAFRLLTQYDFTSDFTARNSSPLRNIQNYCIILNTQLRHALEECNIHPYSLDSISNEIGIKIEKLDSFKNAESLITDTIKAYCRLVQENTYPNLKPLIHLTVTYIKEHLSDNLTVKDTASALTVNANYLSSVFHKEMGMPFMEFVNRERIKQAAALLKHSSLQVQQIAYTVGYNNTSYFAKKFQKIYKKSPRAFRNETLT